MKFEIWHRPLEAAPPTGADYSATALVGEEVRFFSQLDTDIGLVLRWHGRIDERKVRQRDLASAIIKLDCKDFLYWVLENSVVTTQSYTSKTIGFIIKDLIDTYATETLDTSGIEVTGANMTTLSSVTFEQVPLFDAVMNMRKLDSYTFHGEAALPNDKAFYSEKAVTPSGETLTASDIHWLEETTKALGLINSVEVRGKRTEKILFEQAVQDTTQLVTSTSRFIQSFSTGVERLSKIRIFVDKTVTSSGEGIFLRVQPESSLGAAPDDEADFEKDIVRKFLTVDELPSGGLIDFVLDSHQLAGTPATTTYYIIVESDGPTGQRVGKEASSGDLTHTLFFEEQASATAFDASSITTFGTQARPIYDAELNTDAECQDRADGLIAKYANVGRQKVITVSPQKTALGKVGLGKTISVTLPSIAVSALPFILTEKRLEYDALRSPTWLLSELTMVQDERLPDAMDVIRTHELRIQSTERNVERVEARLNAQVNYDEVTNTPTGMIGGARHGGDAHKEVWDFVEMPSSAFEIHSGSPTYDGVFGWRLDDAVTEIVAFQGRIPDHADFSAVDPELTFVLAPVSAGSGNVRIRIRVSTTARGTGAINDGIFVIATLKTIVMDSGIGKVTENTETLAKADMNAGHWLKVQIERLGGDGADTFVGDVGLKSCFFRFRTTKMGEEV